ncbi:uroporphyrinogen-III synthase [Pasteurellaceae bacterium RH1A]|nr:uroporphyrinogen-III synthase [Pasteurellaceae bacterium RH1A]
MNVLITRPQPSGQALVDMLNKVQIFALHQPLVSIEAGRELPQLHAALNQLKAGDYVFAVSKHAVDFATDTLKQTGFHWREDLNYFAVGRQTAQHFAAQSEQQVAYPIESENSEGLLNLPQMQDLTDKTVLILRAETGRELFPEEASRRGAKIAYLECYQRQPVADNLADQISLCKRAGIDTIVVTSGEILQALYDQTLAEDRAWLTACRLLVVGPRLAEQAQGLGWQAGNIILSEKADNQSLFDRLIQNVGR